MVIDCFNSYDNYNFFLVRDKPYNPSGRLQTEEESNFLSEKLYRYLEKIDNNMQVIKGNIDGYDFITDRVKSYLNRKRENNG